MLIPLPFVNWLPSSLWTLLFVTVVGIEPFLFITVLPIPTRQQRVARITIPKSSYEPLPTANWIDCYIQQRKAFRPLLKSRHVQKIYIFYYDGPYSSARISQDTLKYTRRRTSSIPEPPLHTLAIYCCASSFRNTLAYPWNALQPLLVRTSTDIYRCFIKDKCEHQPNIPIHGGSYSEIVNQWKEIREETTGPPPFVLPPVRYVCSAVASTRLVIVKLEWDCLSIMSPSADKDITGGKGDISHCVCLIPGRTLASSSLSADKDKASQHRAM